jgi:hypothetical protein
MEAVMWIGFFGGLAAAALLSVGLDVAFYPHNAVLALIVGMVLGGTLPWVGAILWEAWCA